ncbi:hypothetical protein K440DRAFT_632199 [Wilcoxina mikolae CBS 423.85]|nr:hypothetical protein K440DRAFT_632199 [Wilcoxina mikolae CBS 423.85]
MHLSLPTSNFLIPSEKVFLSSALSAFTLTLSNLSDGTNFEPSKIKAAAITHLAANTPTLTYSFGLLSSISLHAAIRARIFVSTIPFDMTL